VLHTPNNSISMAVSLTSGGGGKPLTAMGSTLWVRLISGCRICAPSDKPKKVAGIDFINYGSHHNAYPVPYFTVACALGITENDIQLFLSRLDKTLTEWKMAEGPPTRFVPQNDSDGARGNAKEGHLAAEVVTGNDALDADTDTGDDEVACALASCSTSAGFGSS